MTNQTSSTRKLRQLSRPCDFVVYLPDHKFIFLPTGAMWPMEGVNARLPWIPTGEVAARGKRRDFWLTDQFRSL
jgi:hypothetical protein